jgi:hypothetical protein
VEAVPLVFELDEEDGVVGVVKGHGKRRVTTEVGRFVEDRVQEKGVVGKP